LIAQSRSYLRTSFIMSAVNRLPLFNVFLGDSHHNVLEKILLSASPLFFFQFLNHPFLIIYLNQKRCCSYINLFPLSIITFYVLDSFSSNFFDRISWRSDGIILTQGFFFYKWHMICDCKDKCGLNEVIFSYNVKYGSWRFGVFWNLILYCKIYAS
jgi:hypothetical protein